MKKVSKKLVLSILLALLSLSTLFLFAGCQSTDKTKAYIQNYVNKAYTTFQYNADTDETTIKWNTRIGNDTIYTIKEFTVYFNMYSGNTLVHREIWYSFSKKIAAGQEDDKTLYFKAKGNITKIEFVDWSAKYATFWETYQIWIYITLGVAALLAFIYIIVMIVNDLELWETWDNIKDFFEEHVWVFWIFIIAGGSGIVASILISYWVQLLIILGGIVATIVLGLIAHLIKHFIDERKYNGDPTPVEEEIEEYNAFGVKKRVVHRRYGINHTENDNDEEDENDEDIETFLYSQSLKELREICREEGITGFTTLNKEETIELILEHLQDNNKK